MGGIGAPELVIILMVVLIPMASVAYSIWAIIDAVRIPAADWDASHQSQALWIALIAGGLVLTCFAGVVFALVYRFAIRPKVIAATA